MSDSETVWVVRSGTSGTTKVYHTDAGCYRLPDDDDRVDERDRAMLDARWDECAYCADSRSMPDSNQSSLRARVCDADNPIQELTSDGSRDPLQEIRDKAQERADD